MNLNEAFKQAVSVPQKKEQSWYLTSAEMLPTLRRKEVAAKQWWWWWQRERERAPKMKIENEKLFVLLVFTFTKPTQFPNQNLNFNRGLEGIWYMHLKICVLLFKNMCENTRGWKNVWKNV